MDDALRSLLCQHGVDVEGGLQRFMKNEALFIKYLRRFPDDPTYASLSSALAAGDMEQAFVAAHTLKGMSANISLVTLAAQFSELVELLRNKEHEKAQVLMLQLQQNYEALCQVLRQV